MDKSQFFKKILKVFNKFQKDFNFFKSFFPKGSELDELHQRFGRLGAVSSATAATLLIEKRGF